VSMDGIVKGGWILFGSCKTKIEGNATMEGSILSWPSPKKSFLLTPQVLKHSFFFFIFQLSGSNTKRKKHKQGSPPFLSRKQFPRIQQLPQAIATIALVSCVRLLLQHVH
jgi:hypothetical protein